MCSERSLTDRGAGAEAKGRASTAAESAFKVQEGVEALEQRFDAHSLECWVPGRGSAV
jgi:hypothetical protein